MRLLGDAELERSAVVANCRMNRDRNLLGSNWLVEDGLFVAKLDLNNVCLSDGKTKRTLVAQLRGSGLEYDRRKRLLVCRGRKGRTLPFRYLGADDHVGPNYTGQPAVTSHYEHRSDAPNHPLQSCRTTG
jgi:hypothetical protein